MTSERIKSGCRLRKLANLKKVAYAIESPAIRHFLELLRKCTEVRQCALAFSFFFCGCRAFLQSVSAAVVQVILDSSPCCQFGASFGGRYPSLRGLPALFVALHTFLIPDGNVAKDEIAGLPAI